MAYVRSMYRVAWSMVIIWSIAAPNILAQHNEPPPPAAYAIRNATVIGADGSVVSPVTLIVRGGLIERMSQDAEIPGDAEVLAGDSMFIYPGLIDAHGTAEYEFPEIDSQDAPPWALPRAVQGFLPHRRIVDHLTGDGEDYATQRKAGIVASAVHPIGRLMQGQGTLVMYRRDADTPSDLVLQPALGPTMSLQGANGGYPVTLFGVMAFYRQVFADASHHGIETELFASDPAGMTPPRWDPDFDAIRAAMRGESTVYFRADLARDIRRALALSEELGFRLMIVGGEEAWMVAEDLRAADVPVLVSADFPEPERWSPDDEVSDDDLDAAALRERTRITNAWRNPGRLVEAGVRIALTTGGGRANLLEGAQKAIEYGMSERQALRAVTAVPASLLSADYLAFVGESRPATFTVTTGPLFDEDTKVAYTFVEGLLERGSSVDDSAPADEPAASMTGEWDVELETPAGTFTLELSIEQSGATFDGTATSQFGEATIRDGLVSGNDVSFVVEAAVGGQSFRIDMTGTIDGNRASGEGESPQGTFEWTARRREGGA